MSLQLETDIPTVMRLNIGQGLHPSLVLQVDLTKIRDKKGFFRVGFTGYSKARSSNDSISELDIWMACTKWWQCGKNGLIFGMLFGHAWRRSTHKIVETRLGGGGP